MKIEELTPCPTSRVPFKLASFKGVPQSAGCYALATFDGDILYIGLSDNLYARFQQHLDSQEKTLATTEGKAIWFYFIDYSAINLAKLERTWLNHFAAIHGRLPILNKVNSPIG